MFKNICVTWASWVFHISYVYISFEIFVGPEGGQKYVFSSVSRQKEFAGSPLVSTCVCVREGESEMDKEKTIQIDSEI